MQVVLASASPRRRELLAAAGVSITVDPVAVDETPLPAESPSAYVDRLARLKAVGGAARHPDSIVIGADTAVVVDGEVFGKPVDTRDARRMLRRLAGRDHEVLTAVALAGRGAVRSVVERTVVSMAALTDRQIDAYIATGEPFDKAGAYAIQGAAAPFVAGIQGSFTNVVGLPLERVLQMLNELA